MLTDKLTMMKMFGWAFQNIRFVVLIGSPRSSGLPPSATCPREGKQVSRQAATCKPSNPTRPLPIKAAHTRASDHLSQLGVCSIN